MMDYSLSFVVGAAFGQTVITCPFAYLGVLDKGHRLGLQLVSLPLTFFCQCVEVVIWNSQKHDYSSNGQAGLAEVLIWFAISYVSVISTNFFIKNFAKR